MAVGHDCAFWELETGVGVQGLWSEHSKAYLGLGEVGSVALLFEDVDSAG